MFRLRDCSEDDTLIIERTGVSFGALVFEPFLLAQERFLLILLNFVVLFQSAKYFSLESEDLQALYLPDL